MEFGSLYPEPYQITALLNEGGNKFGPPARSPGVEWTLGFGDFVFADFRNTGRPDFLAVRDQSQDPYLFFAPNTGAGRFGTPTMKAVAGAQGVIGVGDFNRDGKPDFVAVALGCGSSQCTVRLSVFLGNGDGTFTPGASTSYGASGVNPAKLVYPGDFNRDGKLDLLVWHYGNSVPLQSDTLYEFLGNGDGTFGPPRVLFSELGPFTLADVNRDGWPDIIATKHPMADYPRDTTPEFYIYLGHADGSFSLAHTYAPYAGVTMPPISSMGPRAGGNVPVVGDFNGDGNVDIAAFQRTKSYPPVAYAQLLLGNGDGSFSSTYNVNEFRNWWAPQFVADLNGDGRSEFVDLTSFNSSFHVVPMTHAPALQLRLVSDPVIGSTGHARVSLNMAQSSATTVPLSASDPAITLPGSVTIAAGTVGQAFTFTIGPGFDPHRVFSLQAQLGTETAVAYGTQADGSIPVGFVLTVGYSPWNVRPSETTGDYTPKLTSIGGYATTIQLECLGLPAEAACIFGSDSITLPAGTYTGTSLVISTGSGTPPGSYNITVRATDTKSHSFGY